MRLMVCTIFSTELMVCGGGGILLASDGQSETSRMQIGERLPTAYMREDITGMVLSMKERIDGAIRKDDGSTGYQLRWLAKWGQTIRDDAPYCNVCGKKAVWSDAYSEVVASKKDITIHVYYECECGLHAMIFPV